MASEVSGLNSVSLDKAGEVEDLKGSLAIVDGCGQDTGWFGERGEEETSLGETTGFEVNEYWGCGGARLGIETEKGAFGLLTLSADDENRLAVPTLLAPVPNKSAAVFEVETGEVRLCTMGAVCTGGRTFGPEPKAGTFSAGLAENKSEETPPSLDELNKSAAVVVGAMERCDMTGREVFWVAGSGKELLLTGAGPNKSAAEAVGVDCRTGADFTLGADKFGAGLGPNKSAADTVGCAGLRAVLPAGTGGRIGVGDPYKVAGIYPIELAGAASILFEAEADDPGKRMSQGGAPNRVSAAGG